MRTCAHSNVLAWLLTVTVTAARAQLLPVATFDNGVQPNEVGGWYHWFKRNPSTVSYTHTIGDFRGVEGYSLLIQANKEDSGWCGLWMTLSEDGTGIDTTSYNYISFFIKGQAGNEVFNIKLADPSHQDGLVLGSVTDFVQGGVSATTWQHAIIPLTLVDSIGLQRSAITTLSFDFSTVGAYGVLIDDVYLHAGMEQVIPESGPLPPFEVSTFDSGNANTLGGYFNAFERTPSSAKVTKSWDVFRGSDGKSWQIAAKKSSTGGWCGAWMHLIDWDASPRTYFDATKYDYLTFWVSGETGGESFTVKLADKTWMETHDDAVLAGSVTDFLVGGSTAITTSWQQVLVPLSTLQGQIDLSELGGLTLDFIEPGKQVVYIDDLYFLSKADDVIPLTPADSVSATVDPPLRSMWIWDGNAVITDAAQQAKLWDLCEREQIGVLWLAVPLTESLITGDDILSTPFEFTSVWNADEGLVRSFLIIAHQKNMEVHALAGDPAWALLENHHVSFRFVDGVIAFNGVSPDPMQHFDGVHLDNEPYSLPVWHTRREDLLQELLSLNEECQRRCTNANIAFAIDIPVWLGAIDPKTGEPIGMVTFNGERKSFDKFCIDKHDSVGVMNYRDSVYGMDSMLRFGGPLLEYAASRGKSNIIMGLETYLADPVEVRFPLGLPYAEFTTFTQSDAYGIASNTYYEGFKLATLDDGMNVHIGLEKPTFGSSSQERDYARALQKLANTIGGCYDHDDTAMLTAAKSFILWSSEHEGFAETSTLSCRKGFQTSIVMVGKVTFGDETYEFLQSELGKVEREFALSVAYAGQALHFYASLQQLYDSSFLIRA